MATCVVPGCRNGKAQWFVKVPADSQLRASWRAAIFGATGTSLSETRLFGKHVCQEHFGHQQQHFRGDMYREPTLFKVNHKVLKVSCCQLCLRYEPVDSMFNRMYCLEQNLSLQSLAYKYFRVRHFNTQAFERDSYFCENCVVQIDITHRFCEQITENSRAYERILRKMAKTVVPFERFDPPCYGASSGKKRRLPEEISVPTVPVQVEEEPQDEPEPVRTEEVESFEPPLVKSEPVSTSDCESTMKQDFGTINLEVDDDDAEPLPTIKTEPGLDETAVQIKQELPDETSFPVEVKNEPETEGESSDGEPLAAKNPRLDVKFSCLICKTYCESQDALTNHLKQVHEENFPKDNCAATSSVVVSNNSPRILNKQFSRNEKFTWPSYSCGQCLKSYPTAVLLLHHHKVRNCKRPQYICPQCTSATFAHEEDLTAHVELAHSSSRQSHTCEKCQVVLANSILYGLHQALLCGEKLPKTDVAHLQRCALLFFWQKLTAREAYVKIRKKFLVGKVVTQETVNSWFGRFSEGDFVMNDLMQGTLKELIDDNSTISMEKLVEHLGVEEGKLRVKVALLGRMQKYGRWVPQEMAPMLMKNRFNYCRALLARYKDNESLDSLILCSERWIYYGHASEEPSEVTKVIKKVLLCVWWDHKGLIFHELLEPSQANATDRFQTQFARFTKAMQSIRPKNTRNFIFQYGITEPTARRELKTILTGIGWELLRHPVHSPDIDPTDYHLFQAMQYGFQNLFFANPGQVHSWVAENCRQNTPAFYQRGIRMLPQRWQKVVDSKGEYCGE